MRHQLCRLTISILQKVYISSIFVCIDVHLLLAIMCVLGQDLTSFVP